MYYLQWDLTRFEGSYKIISKYVSIFLPRFWWISKDWRIDCKTFFKNLVHVFYPQKPLNFLKLFSLEFQASENRQAQDRKNIKFQTGTKMTYLAPSLRFHLVILSGILIALIELAPLEKNMNPTSARYVIVVLFGKIISKRFPMYISMYIFSLESVPFIFI